MSKIVTIHIKTCDDCPYMDFDNHEIEEQWGKFWCTQMDMELSDINIFSVFPSNCPLEEEST